MRKPVRILGVEEELPNSDEASSLSVEKIPLPVISFSLGPEQGFLTWK